MAWWNGTPKIIDSHAHYDDARFDSDRDAVLAGLRDAGVAAVINAGSDLDTSARSLALAVRFPFIWAAAGIHPHEAMHAPADWSAQLRSLLQHPRCAALGEIGLDYHYDHSPRDVQRALFAEQMELAAETDMPVVLHERDALADVLDIVTAYTGRVTGVFHCFSGSVDTARTVLSLGYCVSLGGPVTFRNARHAPAVAAYVPGDRLLVETDCPYQAPVPVRGTRNDSANLRYIIEEIARLRGEAPEETARRTQENACRLFRINAAGEQPAGR